MAFTEIYQVEDAPIVVTRYSGQITSADVHAADVAALPLFTRLQAEAVLIIDTSSATETSFKDIIDLLKTPPDPATRATAYPVRPFFVGTHQLARLYVNAARQKQFGGMQIPMFVTLDDAITAARTLLAESKPVAD